MKKVNLFLVGAAKSGTTALAELLSQSPEIFSPSIKEPGYFGLDINPDDFSPEYAKVVQLPRDYFSTKPLKEQHQSFIREASLYQKLYEVQQGEKYLLDSSTVYLLSRLSAEEIARYNPQAKIIIILRNPVERAFSHYKMALQMGLVTGGFKEEWDLDLEKNPKGVGISEMFAETGMYSQQLKRYFSAFSKEQICVLLYEDFKSMTSDIKSQLKSFLELDLPWEKTGEANVSSVPKHAKFNQILKGSGFVQKMKNHLPESLQASIKKWMSQEDLQMSAEMKKELTDYYREDILEVEKITGLNLNHWK